MIIICQRDLESRLRQMGSMRFAFMFSVENSTKIILFSLAFDADSIAKLLNFTKKLKTASDNLPFVINGILNLSTVVDVVVFTCFWFKRF